MASELPSVREAIRGILPARLRRFIRRKLNSIAPNGFRHLSVDSVYGMGLEQKFSEVYARNLFGGANSSSGAGSDLVQTAIIRRELPNILNELGVRSMLDAPCGDWFWMRAVDLDILSYVGIDIVPVLIERNRSEFGRDGVRFEALDLSTGILPQTDLIFSRDCLVHLSFQDALAILRNFKSSGARYLLTTTFTARRENCDLDDTFWRPLNLQYAPFFFPPPLRLINEGCTEGRGKFADKSLGLWELQSLSLG